MPNYVQGLKYKIADMSAELEVLRVASDLNNLAINQTKEYLREQIKIQSELIAGCKQLENAPRTLIASEAKREAYGNALDKLSEKT